MTKQSTNPSLKDVFAFVANTQGDDLSLLGGKIALLALRLVMIDSAKRAQSARRPIVEAFFSFPKEAECPVHPLPLYLAEIRRSHCTERDWLAAGFEDAGLIGIRAVRDDSEQLLPSFTEFVKMGSTVCALKDGGLLPMGSHFAAIPGKRAEDDETVRMVASCVFNGGTIGPDLPVLPKVYRLRLSIYGELDDPESCFLDLAI